MKWVSALSTRPSLEAAVDEVIAATQAALGATPHLGFVFISSTFASEYPRLLPLLNERLQLPALIGCGGGGVIGNQVMATRRDGREAQKPASDGGTTADRFTDRVTDSKSLVELEDEPALVLCLAHLPGATVSAFWLDEEDLPDLDSPPSSWVDYVGVDPRSRPDFVLIADPFTSKISDLLQGMDFAY
ncbi:MAG: hypothetical protein HC771_01730, partial [Synechococcales cyanobacterium CRU_2_2]|nr:hypothetical protein [Synechococcales cyanobacterium CRU_2_2]